MICCLGLFAGFAVGSAIGGPWTIIAPATGFGLGLAADMKLMGSYRKKTGSSGSHGGGCCGGGHMDGKKAESRLKDTDHKGQDGQIEGNIQEKRI